MKNTEYRDEFDELQDKQCKYKITMLGLVNPDQERVNSFLSAEKEYVRLVRKMIRYLKQEISSAEAIKSTVLSNNKEEYHYDY